MSVCAGCGKECTGVTINAIERTWHAECFVCAACQRPFEDGSFVPHEGLPYHKQCHEDMFADKCSGCGKVFAGSYVTACDGMWRESQSHSKCAFCPHDLAL
eukprot:652719-Prymnesium_polylepis.1